MSEPTNPNDEDKAREKMARESVRVTITSVSPIPEDAPEERARRAGIGPMGPAFTKENAPTDADTALGAQVDLADLAFGSTAFAATTAAEIPIPPETPEEQIADLQRESRQLRDIIFGQRLHGTEVRVHVRVSAASADISVSSAKPMDEEAIARTLSGAIAPHLRALFFDVYQPAAEQLLEANAKLHEQIANGENALNKADQFVRCIADVLGMNSEEPHEAIGPQLIACIALSKEATRLRAGIEEILRPKGPGRGPRSGNEFAYVLECLLHPMMVASPVFTTEEVRAARACFTKENAPSTADQELSVQADLTELAFGSTTFKARAVKARAEELTASATGSSAIQGMLDQHQEVAAIAAHPAVREMADRARAADEKRARETIERASLEGQTLAEANEKAARVSVETRAQREAFIRISRRYDGGSADPALRSSEERPTLSQEATAELAAGAEAFGLISQLENEKRARRVGFGNTAEILGEAAVALGCRAWVDVVPECTRLRAFHLRMLKLFEVFGMVDPAEAIEQRVLAANVEHDKVVRALGDIRIASGGREDDPSPASLAEYVRGRIKYLESKTKEATDCAKAIVDDSDGLRRTLSEISRIFELDTYSTSELADCAKAIVDDSDGLRRTLSEISRIFELDTYSTSELVEGVRARVLTLTNERHYLLVELASIRNLLGCSTEVSPQDALKNYAARAKKATALLAEKDSIIDGLLLVFSGAMATTACPGGDAIHARIIKALESRGKKLAEGEKGSIERWEDIAKICYRCRHSRAEHSLVNDGKSLVDGGTPGPCCLTSCLCGGFVPFANQAAEEMRRR